MEQANRVKPLRDIFQKDLAELRRSAIWINHADDCVVVVVKGFRHSSRVAGETQRSVESQ